MQTVLNQEEPEFRSSEQERAVAAVLNLDTPLVVVLPTGGGKTLPFMLAASLPDPGVTIFVAPFRALLHDYVKRLKLNEYRPCTPVSWTDTVRPAGCRQR